MISAELKGHLAQTMLSNALDLKDLLVKHPEVSQENYFHDLNSVHNICHDHCRVIQELGCENVPTISTIYDQIDAIATKAGELMQQEGING